VGKANENVIEKLVKVWMFDRTLARRLYFEGAVLSCDKCHEPFLKAECRTSLTGPYVGIDDDTFGMLLEGEDICRSCLPEKARAHLFDVKPVIPSGACPDCAGTGRLHCPYCKTMTRVDCTACAGVGGDECDECTQGTVAATCHRCNGTGRGGFLRLEKCFKCNGEGKIQEKCSYCHGERLVSECQNCAGSGKIVCPHCSGAGTISCPSCKGMGKKSA
jgi:hypothetical protein